MTKISPLSLYIINEVRLRRWILGLSSRQLSELIELSSSYVGMVESCSRNEQYPPETWPKLAMALNCEIHDLLPSNVESHIEKSNLVEKKVLSLEKEHDVILIINSFVEYNLFDQPKTFENMASHLYLEREEQKQILKKVLDIFVEANKLSKRNDGYVKS